MEASRNSCHVLESCRKRVAQPPVISVFKKHLRRLQVTCFCSMQDTRIASACGPEPSFFFPDGNHDEMMV